MIRPADSLIIGGGVTGCSIAYHLGCSMCLGMNPDQLVGREMSASSSNRNFIGRQGSPTGRTLLMSPAMVAAAAITGAVADVREILK